MTKLETVKRLTERESRRIDERIAELRRLQEGSFTGLADRIEPLAQSMAALADDAREQILELRKATAGQAEEWGRERQRALEGTARTAAQIHSSASELKNAAREAKGAVKWWVWEMWIGVILAALVAGAIAPTVSALWRNLLKPKALEDRAYARKWKRFAEGYRMLSTEDRERIDKMMGWNADTVAPAKR